MKKMIGCIISKDLKRYTYGKNVIYWVNLRKIHDNFRNFMRYFF